MKLTKKLAAVFLTATLLASIGGNPAYASAEEVSNENSYVAQGTTYDSDGAYFRDTASQRIGAVISDIEGIAIQSLLTASKQGPAEGNAKSTDIFGVELKTDTTGLDLAGKSLVFEYEKLVQADIYFTPIIETTAGSVFTLPAKTHKAYLKNGDTLTEGGLTEVAYKINNVSTGFLEPNMSKTVGVYTYVLPLAQFVCNADLSAVMSDIKSVKFVFSFGAGSTYQLKSNVGNLSIGTLSENEGGYLLESELTVIFDAVKENGEKAVEGNDWDYYINTSVADADPKAYFDAVPVKAGEWYFGKVGAHQSTAVDVKFPSELRNDDGFIDISTVQGMLLTVDNADKEIGFRMAVWDGDGTKWSAMRTGASLCIPDGVSSEFDYSDVYWRRTGNIPANYKGKILVPFTTSEKNPVFSGGTSAFPALCSKNYDAIRFYMTNQDNLGADLIVENIQFITCLKDYVSTVYVNGENGAVTTDKIDYNGMIAVRTGEKINLTVTPEVGFEMKSVKVNEEPVSVTAENSSFALTVNEDMTIDITCDLINYTITYKNMDGAVNDEANPETYTIKTATIELIDPTKEGDTFLGWYSTADFSGESITEIPRGSVGNIELYAKWQSDVKIEESDDEGCFGSISLSSGLFALLPAAIFWLKRKNGDSDR